MPPLFHLAIPVTDLEQARTLYVERLGCSLGRTSDRWIDFNFFGHQLTVHLVEGSERVKASNPVDGDAVPIPHFGVILPQSEWQGLHERLAAAGTPFTLDPRTRFQGQVGEQGTFFVLDPSGNALEFKTFGDADRVFATSVD